MSNKYHIRNAQDLANAIMSLAHLDISIPKIIAITDYEHDRSKAQNAISHKWYAIVAKEIGEDTPMGVRCYCKLHFGVPILRAADADFREAYDKTLKTLTYEQKLIVMQWFPVTSLMKVEQMSQYLNHVQHHYADRVQLTFPGDYQ